MAYVKRDSRGAIEAVSREPADGFPELVADDDGELQGFLHSVGSNSELARSDLEFVRVLEDVLNLLMEKNILMFTDLPPEAQKKVLQRQALRGGDNALDLLDQDPPV
jgi:hypothetical protein